MTVTDSPSNTPAAPPPRRSGFYVAPWILAVVGGLVLLAAGFLVGLAVDHHDHRDRPFFRGGDGGDHPGFRILVVLVVLALVITGIVLLVRHYSRRNAEMATPAADTPAAATTAEQVLADRFARGEIDEAEFLSRRNALRS
jgi:putative membrane protein